MTNKKIPSNQSATSPLYKTTQRLKQILSYTTTCLFTTTLAICAYSLSLSIPTKAETSTTTKKTISLIEKDGSKLNIGQLILTKTPTGQTPAGHTFTIDFDTSKFSEYFLSMRPFKCIDGPQTFCHLIYPYKTKKLITPTNHLDLEYALIFVHKNAKEYGINFWNGVYYRLKQNDDGSFTGTVWETDMNELASPPDNEYDRPIGNADLVEAADGKHRFPQIEIK